MRAIRHWFQRRVRGWDDSDLGRLDETIAKFVVPRLERFMEIDHGCPNEFSPDQWKEALGEMLYALKAHAIGCGESEKDIDWGRVQKGMELFGKFFRFLWD